MKGLQYLPGADLAELAIRMAQAERRLALVHAGPEQFELEGRSELAHCRGREPSHAQPALAYAGERDAVLAKLPVEGGQLVEAHRVEPVRIDGVQVDAHVEHGEAIDLDGGGLRHRIRRRSEQQRERHYQPPCSWAPTGCCVRAVDLSVS